jgi:deoxyribose-phosphate aldolase
MQLNEPPFVPGPFNLAACIDHTLLNPLATRADIERHCGEAVHYGFHAVCVLPRWTAAAADILRDSKVQVVGLSGFPFGADSPAIKARQAREAIMAGADEIDMVADLSAIVEPDARRLATDIVTVLHECRRVRPRAPLKVIIESAALTDEQIVFACRLIDESGADFIKTSTGLLAQGGATVEAVRLMAENAPNCRVKAAGGIRTAQQAMEMISAGAARIGASASVRIMETFEEVRQP